MSYVRTKDEIYETKLQVENTIYCYDDEEINIDDIIKDSNKLEDLFDEEVVVWKDKKWQPTFKRYVLLDNRMESVESMWGAIWILESNEIPSLKIVAKLVKGKYELLNKEVEYDKTNNYRK